MSATLNYSVKKAGIFAALVDLPAALGHVEANGRTVESFAIVPPAPGAPPLAAGYQRLEVRFKERLTGDFRFDITGDLPRAKPDEPVTVAVPHPVGGRARRRPGGRRHPPEPRPENDRRRRPAARRASTTRGDGRAATTPRDAAHARVQPTGARRSKPAQLAFTLRKPRVSAEIASRVSLRESLVAYQWTVAYTIEYAGIDDLVLDAPPEVADDLQFSGDDIKEKAREDEKDAAGKPTGRRLWHVRLQQQETRPLRPARSTSSVRCRRPPRARPRRWTGRN